VATVRQAGMTMAEIITLRFLALLWSNLSAYHFANLVNVNQVERLLDFLALFRRQLHTGRFRFGFSLDASS
jgi:hypothetical protein